MTVHRALFLFKKALYRVIFTMGRPTEMVATIAAPPIYAQRCWARWASSSL